MIDRAMATWRASGYEAVVRVLRAHPNSPDVFQVEGVFGMAWALGSELVWH